MSKNKNNIRQICLKCYNILLKKKFNKGCKNCRKCNIKIFKNLINDSYESEDVLNFIFETYGKEVYDVKLGFKDFNFDSDTINHIENCLKRRRNVLKKSLKNKREKILNLEELIKEAFKPSRIQYIINNYGMDFDY